MNSLLFLFTSIGFFLLSIQSILFWTFLWEKSEYRLKYLLGEFRVTLKSKLLITQVLLFLLLLLYGVVIFKEGFIFWYQLIAATVLILESLIFIREIFQANFVKPSLNIKTLVISVFSLFLVSFLYTIPIIDIYAWMILLVILIPIIVSILVLILAFPTEIYIDLILQKIEEKLSKNKKTAISVIIGDDNINKEYLNILINQFNKSIVHEENDNLLSITKTFIKEVKIETKLFIFGISSRKRDEIRKIFKIIKPDYVIFTEMNLSKDEKKKVDMYRKLINDIPRNVKILLNYQNKIIKKITKRKMIIYKIEKRLGKSQIFINGKNFKQFFPKN